VSSHTSGPPTPTYPVFNDDGHSYHGANIMSEQSGLSNGHMNSQAQLVHNYSSGLNVHHSVLPNRFDSPPPILAPIQNDRFVRRSDESHSQSPSHTGSPYIHHPQPLPDYQYHAPIGISSGWKPEGGMRKSVSTVV
jgi:zinc finger protein CreA/MIG